MNFYWAGCAGACGGASLLINAIPPLKTFFNIPGTCGLFATASIAKRSS